MKKFLGKDVNYSSEIIAGTITFLTMSYIIFVNPDILANTGMDKTALIIITALVSGIVTILTGIYTNSPFAMAPGMGLNAFFAFTLVIGQKIRWETALGMVFLSGILFLLLTFLGFRQKIVRAIPKDLMVAITVGIGIFITFIGLKNLGLIVSDKATLVRLGDFTPQVLLGILGFIIIIVLDIKKIKGSWLLGILLITILSVILGYGKFPEKIFTTSFDVSKIFFKIDILSALKFAYIAPIFSLMFVDLFDSIGSIIGLAKKAELEDEKGEIPLLSKLLELDAGATMIGALFGTSTTTTYIESASGISAGGRTGLTSITTGLLFIMAIFFVPLIMIVPSYATAPTLIMVGYAMMKGIGEINFKEMEIGIPSFIIIIMIALSFSISTGIAFGFITYTLIKIIKLKFKEISPTLWFINLLSISFFVF